MSTAIPDRSTQGPFSGRTRTFTEPQLCAAVPDRLTFAEQITEIGTSSLSLAHARTKRASRPSRHPRTVSQCTGLR